MSNVVRNIVYMLSILVKASALDVLKETMVPVGGLEPPRIAATDFESVVSTNSTTPAF